MKKLLLLVATLTFTLGMSAVVFADAPSKVDINRYKVTWSDEFNGTKLDENVWTPLIGNGFEYGNSGWGNKELEYYKAENATVANGKLTIKAKYEAGAGIENGKTFNFSSARLATQNKKSVGYGYLEARIQIPSAKGIWPAFWTMGTNGREWPGCGEIDIMEAFNTDYRIQYTIHNPQMDNWKQDLCNYNTSYLVDRPKTEWHTYGCYRDGNVVAFYIDREQVESYPTADGLYPCYHTYSWTWHTDIEGRRSVLNDDQFILLNVACGGNLTQGVNPGTDLNADMNVDYVRHYVYDPNAPTVKPTTKVSKPAKAKIKKLKNVKKKKLKITIKKVKGANGYQVRWCDNKKFDGYEQKNTKKPKLTIKRLDKKTTYWVKARAFKKVNGAKLYGKWSSVKKKKIKK